MIPLRPLSVAAGRSLRVRRLVSPFRWPHAQDTSTVSMSASAACISSRRTFIQSTISLRNVSATPQLSHVHRRPGTSRGAITAPETELVDAVSVWDAVQEWAHLRLEYHIAQRTAHRQQRAPLLSAADCLHASNTIELLSRPDLTKHSHDVTHTARTANSAYFSSTDSAVLWLAGSRRNRDTLSPAVLASIVGIARSHTARYPQLARLFQASTSQRSVRWGDLARMAEESDTAQIDVLVALLDAHRRWLTSQGCVNSVEADLLHALAQCYRDGDTAKSSKGPSSSNRRDTMEALILRLGCVYQRLLRSHTRHYAGKRSPRNATSVTNASTIVTVYITALLEPALNRSWPTSRTSSTSQTIRHALFHLIGARLLSELKMCVSEMSGPPASQSTGNRDTSRSDAMSPDRVLARLQVMQANVQQCARLLESTPANTPREPSSSSTTTCTDPIAALVDALTLTLDVQHTLLSCEGVLPSPWSSPIAAASESIQRVVLSTAEHSAEVFPALCQPFIVQRMERLRHHHSTPAAPARERGVYVAVSHGLLTAARIFYAKYNAQATLFASTTLAQYAHARWALASALSLAAPPGTPLAALDVATHLHGVALLCASVMALGISADTVIGSGLCVSLSVIEALDVETVHSVFAAPREQENGHDTARVPSRLSSAILNGTMQTLETSAAAVRRMVVTPTQLLQARIYHNTARDVAESVMNRPTRLAAKVARGSQHLSSRGTTTAKVLAAVDATSSAPVRHAMNVSVSAALPYEKVEEQVEAALYVGLRALVQAVCGGDTERAMSIVVPLSSLVTFFGVQDSLLLHAELVSLLRSGVSQRLVSLGQCDADSVAHTWRRVGVERAMPPGSARDGESWFAEASEWCTCVAATTPGMEKALQAMAVFFMPRVHDTLARAQRRRQRHQQSTLPATAGHTRGAGSSSNSSRVVEGDDDVADFTDPIVVEQHVTSALRLTGDLAVLGTASSVQRQLAALHHALLAARRATTALVPSASTESRERQLLGQVQSVQDMLTYTRCVCLPVRRHESTHSWYASNAAVNAVVALHLESVRGALSATHGYVTSSAAQTVQGAPSRLDEGAGPTAVLLAAAHLVYTTDTHFPVTSDVNAMRKVRVEWLSTALTRPLDDLYRHNEYVKDAIARVVPRYPVNAPENTTVATVAALHLAVLCEVAAVTCTAGTVHVMTLSLYTRLWDCVEECVQSWRGDTRTQASQDGQPEKQAFFRSLLARITCTLASVFGLSTDDGIALQSRFNAGLQQITYLLTVDELTHVVRGIFTDAVLARRQHEATTEQMAEAAHLLSASLVSVLADTMGRAVSKDLTASVPSDPKRKTKTRTPESRHGGGGGGAVVDSMPASDLLAVVDALTRCPSSSSPPSYSLSLAPRKERTKLISTQQQMNVNGEKTAIICELLRRLAVQETNVEKKKRACGNDEATTTTMQLASDMTLHDVCSLLRVCTREQRTDADALNTLMPRLSRAAVTFILARFASQDVTPCDASELCDVVEAVSGLSGEAVAEEKEAVLRVAALPLMRTISALTPEQLVRVMEAYARSAAVNDALWVVLTARVADMSARVSLTLSSRLVHVAMGSPPFHRTTPTVRTRCRAAASPLFERQVRQALQSDPNFFTSGTPTSQDTLRCLLTCFPEEAVSGAVLESLAAQPTRLSISVMKFALGLAAARSRESGTKAVVAVLGQRCTEDLIVTCGPRDLVQLSRGLVACQYRSSTLLAAIRTRLGELAGHSVSLEEATTASPPHTTPRRGGKRNEQVARDVAAAAWCVDGEVLANLADVVVAFGSSGAEDAVLVDIFTSEIARLAQHGAPPSQAPPPSSASLVLTASQVCALLNVCRLFGLSRARRVTPAVDALLAYLSETWLRVEADPKQCAVLLDCLTARDLEAVLSVCLSEASFPKAHEALIHRIAKEVYGHIHAGAADGNQAQLAAWRSDLLLLAQILSGLAQLGVRDSTDVPVLHTLSEVLYSQRRQLLRRRRVLETTQHAMRLMGSSVHSDLYKLVMG